MLQNRAEYYKELGNNGDKREGPSGSGSSGGEDRPGGAGRKCKKNGRERGFSVGQHTYLFLDFECIVVLLT